MPIIDLHCDTLTALKAAHKELRSNDMNLDLLRMQQQHILCQDFAVFVRLTEHQDVDAAWQYTLDCIAFFKNQLEKNKELVLQVTNYDDLGKAQKEQKIGALLSVEEGGVLGTDLGRLEQLYQAGVRLLTISWNFPNTLSYPHSSEPDIMQKNLRPFGRKVVEAMCDMHMLVDVSHLNDGGFWDVAHICRGPFVASHSNARTVTGHTRNLTDEMLKTLAEHGGVTGINFFSKFLGDDATGSLEQILKHIAHIKKVGGIEVLALGSDFDGFGGASGVRRCDDFPKLLAALEQAGYSSEEIEKLTYKNALRVIKDVL